MTAPVGQFVDSTQGRTSTNPFITIIEARAPTGNDGINNGLQVGQRWIDSSDNNEEYFLLGFIASNGYVQANWVLLGGSGSVETLTGNSGPAVVPTAGNINVVGNGSTGILFAGAASTLTATLNAIPNSALANSSITLTQGTGISITGSPVSLGGAATIAASTAVPLVFHTDSGDATPAANAITFHGTGGTTISGSGSTVEINSGGGTPGELDINVLVFTTSGTYTPTAGMQFAKVEVVGGGGGGAGCIAGSGGPPHGNAGGGGGGGGYANKTFSSASIGASQSVTIGAGGNGGAAGLNPGLTGGTTSLGSLISATGGLGGSAFDAVGFYNPGGAGGVGSNGDFNTHGAPGGGSCGASVIGNNVFTMASVGGSSFFGGGATGADNTGGFPGNNGTSYGGGAGGGISRFGGDPAQPGGNGFPGVVIVTEYGGTIAPSAFAWVNVTTGTQALARNTGYVIDNGASLVTLTLPAIAAIGDTFVIQGQSSGGWKVNVNTGQIVNLGNTPTTITTGSVASTNQWDTITIRCTTANTTFAAVDPVGNFTII